MPSVKIEVDIHERESGLLEAIIERGLEATEKSLISGDVVLKSENKSVGIELKRGNDYDKSLHDQRLQLQIMDLNHYYDYSMLIVENWLPWITDNDDGWTIELKESNHKKSLRTLNRRITVQETSDQNETLDLICEIARDLKAGKLFSVKRPVVMEPELNPSIALLCSLPHINRVTAEILLEMFKSPNGMFKALSTIPDMKVGLTKSRCEKIRKAFYGDK